MMMGCPLAVRKRPAGSVPTTVPTANPTLVTIVCESADYRCDEGLVLLDLVRSGRPGPVTGDAVVVAEMRTAHVPVKIFCLQIERKRACFPVSPFSHA